MRTLGLCRGLPEEPSGRHYQGVGHVVGVAARRSSEGALHVVADEALHEPLMAIEADRTAGIEVVEDHEFLGQGVVIRRNLAWVHAEFGIAVRLGDIP